MTVANNMVNTHMDLVKAADIINLLQITGKISANVTFDLPQGAVVHLNDDGEFETGATGTQMPMFLWRGATSADVANPGVNEDGDLEYVSGIPDGVTTAFPAVCGMEIASSRYDPDQEYVVNDLLRGVTANTNSTTGGRLTKAGITLYTNCVCGVVSRGTEVNPLTRRTLLYFWPVYLPGSA